MVNYCNNNGHQEKSRIYINTESLTLNLCPRQAEGALPVYCFIPAQVWLFVTQAARARGVQELGWGAREPKIGGFPTPGVKSPESQVRERSVAARWAQLRRAGPAECWGAGAGRGECNVPYSSVPLLRSETLITHRRHWDTHCTLEISIQTSQHQAAVIILCE